jgi:hypothetical protein
VNELGLFLRLENDGMGMQEQVYASLVDLVLKDRDQFVIGLFYFIIYF